VKRVDVLSGLWLLLLLAAVAYVGGAFSTDVSGRVRQSASSTAQASVVDPTGRALPRRNYRRIASASPLADGLLLELAEPERIAALSHQGRLQDPEAQRYGQRAEISSPKDLEQLITLRVDVLIGNHLGAESELARVRASGIGVFDLGEMRGLDTLQPAILALADLLGERSRGERLWQRLSRRMRAVASDVAPADRKAALYVASYAGKLYGGTRGTSYHDVLNAAGLVDVAASAYRDWPQYDPEQLLSLRPPWLVTNTGMAGQLCGNVWLSRLQACRARPARVLEVDGDLIGDPGLRMLDAAEALHVLAYPAPRR
jgi:iron complex transport system substrate-binding protein